MRYNRNLVYIGSLILVLFLATWGLEHKRDTHIDNLIQQLSSHITAEDWKEAASTLDALRNEWMPRRFWLALNNSIADQQTFERTLTQIGSYIQYTDKMNAAVQTALLHQIWRELGD